VNNNYVSVSYPVQVIDQQDKGWTNPDLNDNSCTPKSCGAEGQNDASMQASWNFQPDLNTISQDLLTGQPTSDAQDLVCSLSSNDCNNMTELTLAGIAAEPIGGRALLSELDLGDIAGYDFPAAELVNAAGKAVAPTQTSVEDAVKDMETNPDGITQYYDFTNTDPNAYPLAMVDYAMVPTCGLSSSEASDIANFLTKVATTGQTQGETPGDLAPGYYPLNAKQKAQTLEAAAEVRAQDCKSAPPDRTIGGRPAPNDVGSPKGNSPAGNTTPSASGKKPPSSATTPSLGAATPRAQSMAFGQKSSDSGLTGVLQLLAIIIGVLLLVGGSAAWALTATGKWPVVRARLTAALGWLGGLVVRRA
jgi:hypothetical protein